MFSCPGWRPDALLHSQPQAASQGRPYGSAATAGRHGTRWRKSAAVRSAVCGWFGCCASRRAPTNRSRARPVPLASRAEPWLDAHGSGRAPASPPRRNGRLRRAGGSCACASPTITAHGNARAPCADASASAARARRGLCRRVREGAAATRTSTTRSSRARLDTRGRDRLHGRQPGADDDASHAARGERRTDAPRAWTLGARQRRHSNAAWTVRRCVVATRAPAAHKTAGACRAALRPAAPQRSRTPRSRPSLRAFRTPDGSADYSRHARVGPSACHSPRSPASHTRARWSPSRPPRTNGTCVRQHGLAPRAPGADVPAYATTSTGPCARPAPRPLRTLAVSQLTAR